MGFNIIKDEKKDFDFNLRCDVGVFFDLEKHFKKPYAEIVKGLSSFTLKDILSLLYVGLQKETKAKLQFNDFVNTVSNGNIGITGLFKLVQEYLVELQTIGMNDQEKKEFMDTLNKSEEELKKTILQETIKEP